MNENGLEHNVKIIQGFDTTPIESVLFRSVFSIILDCNAYYKKATDELFLELSCSRQ